MTNPNSKQLAAVILCAAVTMMSACGESDLEEIHEQALDDAAADIPTSPGTSSDEASDPSPAPATPALIDLSLYDLVFSDEFNDTSLDGEKWQTAPLSPETVIYDQLQYYVDIQDPEETFDSPFVFDGDTLTINASPTPQDLLADANGQGYLSGLLTTRDRFDFTYGYIEARVSVSQGRGIWPSLWMLGSQTGGLRPEVYIFEYDGLKPDNAFHNYNYVDESGSLRSPGQREVLVQDFSDGFHTVGLRWIERELLFFIDGQPTWRVIGENVPSEDMYLILNLAIGGLWTGAPDATTPDPASLVVDYVRVYGRLFATEAKCDSSSTYVHP